MTTTDDTTTAEPGRPGRQVAVSEQGETGRVPVALDGPLTTLDAAWRYAAHLAQSDLVPSELRGKPANVLLVVMKGQRLGLDPATALEEIYVVKGRTMMSGKVLLAKLREHGHRVEKLTHTSRECTIRLTRGDTGEQTTETFTVEDAAAARLCQLGADGRVTARSKSGEVLPWEAYTRRMLMWRAVKHAVDFLCPEIRMGLLVEGDLDDQVDPEGVSRVVAERVHAERPATVADLLGEPPAPGEEPDDPASAPDDVPSRDVHADVADVGDDPEVADAEIVDPPADRHQLQQLGIVFGELGASREEKLLAATLLLRRDIATTGDLTDLEAARLLDFARDIKRTAARGQVDPHTELVNTLTVLEDAQADQA